MAIRKADLSHASETGLVLGALLGDMAAFDELVRRFRGAVVLAAEGVLGSRPAAEDVAQEAFLLAFKALPQLQDPARFAGWLCAITQHRARRVLRREIRSEPTEPSKLDRLISAHSPALTAHPEQLYAQDAECAEISAALVQLPPEDRLVLQLRYWEEWPIARIAEFLSLPITTVKWRLHQARRRVCRELTAQTEETWNE